MSGPMDPATSAELWRELAAVHLSSCEDGTEAAIMTGLADGFDHHSKRADAAEAELAKWISGDGAMSAGLRVRLESAETEAAQRLLDEGEPVGLRAIVLDRAAKWIAIGGTATDRRDKQLAMYSALGHELIGLARTKGKQPPPSGLRARTVAAESDRDKYRAKLIGLMGPEGFEAFDNDVPY